MTDSIASLLMRVAGDIPDRLHQFLQNLHSRSSKRTLLEQPEIEVILPFRLNLRRLPSNKVVYSVEMKKTISFPPQEAQTITTHAEQNHLTKKDALLELMKLSLEDDELIQEISRKVQKAKKSQVKLDIELWDKVTWHEKHSNNHTV